MKKLFTLIVAALMTICANAATTTVGNEDNSSTWWTAFSDYYTVPEGYKAHVTFKNYSSKQNNWNNWILITHTANTERNGSGYSEYFALRNDNYGWGDYYDGSGLYSLYNWDTFKDDMDGSTVDMWLYNESGIIYMTSSITTAAGTVYPYTFHSTTTTANDFSFFFTIELGHLTDVNVDLVTEKQYTVDANIEATVGGATKNASFKKQTVTTYTTDAGALMVKIPAASVESTNCTYTMSESTISGLTKDADGNVSLADGATPVLSCVRANKNGSASATLMHANITEVSGNINGETAQVTVKANIDGGTMTVVYTPWVAKLVKTVEYTYQNYSDSYPNYEDTDWGLVNGATIKAEYYDNDSIVIKNWMNQEGYDLHMTYNATTGYITSVDNAYGQYAGWAYCGPNPGGQQDWYAFVNLYNGSSWVSGYNQIYLGISFDYSTWYNYNLKYVDPIEAMPALTVTKDQSVYMMSSYADYGTAGWLALEDKTASITEITKKSTIDPTTDEAGKQVNYTGIDVKSGISAKTVYIKVTNTTNAKFYFATDKDGVRAGVVTCLSPETVKNTGAYLEFADLDETATYVFKIEGIQVSDNAPADVDFYAAKFVAGQATSAQKVAAANNAAVTGKFFKNGQIIIVKNGKQYNAAGAQMK